jgi:hypothetical protein
MFLFVHADPPRYALRSQLEALANDGAAAYEVMSLLFRVNLVYVLLATRHLFCCA